MINGRFQILSLSLLLFLSPHVAMAQKDNTIAKAMPSVVNIAVIQEKSWAEKHPSKGHKRPGVSIGSGVIIDAQKGYIVTNAHVIEHEKTMVVSLNNQRRYTAKLIGSDPATDIALVQIKAKHLKALTFAKPNSLNLGDRVTAIGSPFGLKQSVTSGIVSGLNRHIGLESFENFIQTDAPINPGNSGGALINSQGLLVGMNTANMSPNGGNIGIGFAIPVDMIQGIVKQLVQFGKVSRGQLGVIVQDLTPTLADAFGLKTPEGGAVVNSVEPASSADLAGVQVGDVIQSINKHLLHNASEVRSLLSILRTGTALDITIIRQGSTQHLHGTLKPAGKGKAQYGSNALLAGLDVVDFDRVVKLKQRIKGVQIADVKEGSAAWLANLHIGDVIMDINRHSVNNLSGYQQLAKALAAESQLLIRVRRGGNVLFQVIGG